MLLFRGDQQEYYAGAMATVAFSGDEDGYGDGHSEHGDDDDDVVDGGS